MRFTFLSTWPEGTVLETKSRTVWMTDDGLETFTKRTRSAFSLTRFFFSTWDSATSNTSNVHQLGNNHLPRHNNPSVCAPLSYNFLHRNNLQELLGYHQLGFPQMVLSVESWVAIVLFSWFSCHHVNSRCGWTANPARSRQLVHLVQFIFYECLIMCNFLIRTLHRLPRGPVTHAWVEGVNLITNSITEPPKITLHTCHHKFRTRREEISTSIGEGK